MKANVHPEKSDESRPLLYYVEDGIAFLTLNRPDKLNAFDAELTSATNAAFAAFKSDGTARVMVVSAAGERAFSAGFDIADGENSLGADGLQAAASYDLDFLRDNLNGKPVVAAIQGHCVGLGVALALAADIRIGGTNSVFSVPEARIGISAVQLPALLVEKIGYSHATYFLLRMGPLGVDWAMQSGFLHEAIDPADVKDRAIEVARELATQAPLALSAHKKLLMEATPSRAEEVMKLGLAERKRTLSSDDFAEGRRAFIENRKPRFKGK